MANRRFEMFEYRQVLTRVRLGDTDRAIARAGLMGRRKTAQLRRGRLARCRHTVARRPRARRVPGFGTHTVRGRLAGGTTSRADHAVVASGHPGHHHPRRPRTQPRLHRLVLLGAPLPRSEHVGRDRRGLHRQADRRVSRRRHRPRGRRLQRRPRRARSDRARPSGGEMPLPVNACAIRASTS